MALKSRGGIVGDDARSRRERVMAAMVRSCATRGLEATSVADLLELSGVSRTFFYTHFENKLDCFMAMLEETTSQVTDEVERRTRAAAPGRPQVEAALHAIAELGAAHRAAAHVCMIDAFGAGPDARAILESVVFRIEPLLAAGLAANGGGAEMPPKLLRGMTGAALKIFQNRVAQGQAEGLPPLAPRLADWLLDYRPPPQPLRQRRVAAPAPLLPPFGGNDPAGRIMRALASCVAENGYTEATVASIAARGRLSQRTFYEHFAGKEEAALAALDASGAQMLAAVTPAIRRAPDWPTAVQRAYTAMCGFMAAEPDFARLRAVEAYAAGSAALASRDRAGVELLAALLETAPQDVMEKADPLALEAIAAAVYALVYDCVSRDGPEELPRVVPTATYLALAPFVGPERACEVANDDGRRR